MKRKIQVPCLVRSDDWKFEAIIDAKTYLRTAKYEHIVAMKMCGWKDCDATDRIAMEHRGKALNKLWVYLEISNNGNGDMGYVVSLEEQDVLTWLRKNRPKIHARLIKEEYAC